MEDTVGADPNYIEDFLLCHRTFLDSSLEVMSQLLTWFERLVLRDRVTRYKCPNFFHACDWSAVINSVLSFIKTKARDF